MKLKIWRSLEKISKQQAAALCGVGKSAWSKYEAGRVPQPEVARRILRASKGRVEPNDLYHLPELDALQAARAQLIEVALEIDDDNALAVRGDLYDRLWRAVDSYRAALAAIEAAGLEAAA